MGRRLVFVAAGCLVIAGVAGWLWYQSARASTAQATLVASGTLEADEVLIASQVTGPIATLPLAEGSWVSERTVVATIDDRLIQRQIAQADVATRRLLELQQENYVLRAPIGGIVTRVPVRVGELAMPGEVLLTVANLDQLKLTLYVREADLASISVGQHLTVTADPFPNRAFGGRITSINQQAEFTPRNIQTGDDRLNLVFGVQAVVANPDGALKPGMPVQARFDTGGGA